METENKDETIITKLIVNEKPMYIKVLWTDTDSSVFSIQIYLEDRSWLGIFTNEVANKHIQRLKQTREEYLLDVKNCFIKMNPGFKYDFNESTENKGTFSWKKKFDGSAVILHGSLEVLPSTDSKNDLIDNLIEENLNLSNNLVSCRNKINASDCELKKHTEELEKLHNTNSIMEDTLLGKFVEILNTKKRRIRVLEDALNNIDNN